MKLIEKYIIKRWHADHKKHNPVYIFLESFPFEVVSCLLYNLKTIKGLNLGV